MKLLHQIGAILGPLAAVLAASSDGPTWIRGAGALLGALVSLLAVLDKGWSKPPPAAFLLLLFVLAFTGSCSHVPPPIADFGRCLNTALSSQVADILTEVETDLAGGDYWAALVDLAKKVGWDAVDCAVSEVLGKAEARLRDAPGEGLEVTKSEHARLWLARR